MNDLIRPALYDAWHEIVPLAAPAPGAARRRRSGRPGLRDRRQLRRGPPLPPLAAGDCVALMSAGAYGAAMGSGYNTRLPAPEVLVRGGEFAVDPAAAEL